MAAITAASRRVLSKYVEFSGRASRPEFWWWALAVLLLQAVTQLLDYMVFGSPETGGGQPISALVSLGLLLPWLAVAARRLHDSGRSGWWLLIGLIPIVGFLVLIYFYIQPSDSGPNDFGPPDPLPTG